MTPTEQAARWLADVERYTPPYTRGNWITEADALAAIARHLAPGDDLAAQAEAAMEGVTDGPWRVDGEPWNQIVWSGAENRVCFMAHSNGLDDDRDVATARFIAFAREWVPEAAARISALTATVAELQALVSASEAHRYKSVGELLARLARMEGALTDIDALDPEKGRIGTYSENAIRGLVLRMGEIARAALTDGGKDE